MTDFTITKIGERPDFRLLISFLWGDEHDVDTDGDAANPASRSWTELYCRERKSPNLEFEIEPIRQSPLVLRVSSPVEQVAARVAYFLQLETGCEVRVNTAEGPPISPPDLAAMCGPDFALDAALKRTDESVWRLATPQAPNPRRRYSREQLIELVRKIQQAEGTAEEIDSWLGELDSAVPHPNTSDLIFFPDREMSPEEIVEVALTYEPLTLKSAATRSPGYVPPPKAEE